MDNSLTESEYVIALKLEKEHRKRTKYIKQAAASMQTVVEWIEQSFYIPERVNEENPAMILAPYQRAVLNEAFRRNDDGKLIYDVILWSDIKKSAKSTIAAAVLLYRALHTKRGRFRVVANDLNQADSRVFDFIRTAIELNPVLEKQARIRNYKIYLMNGARIEAVPIDPKGEAGGNDDMIEFTELHAAENKASQRMWTELTLSPLKHGYSQRWIDTYAGHSGESPILEPLYERGVKEGERLTLPGAPEDLEVYRSGSMLTLWNTVPRLPWQTPEYYASEESVQTPSEFRRVHRNAWESSMQSFVPIEWWDKCRVAVLPELDKYREIVIALDAAVINDCFAMIALSRHGDQTVVRYSRAWKPRSGRIEFTNPSDKFDPDYPEGALRKLCDEYNVICVAYDPYQLQSFCRALHLEGIAMFKEFNQQGPRLIADKMLYDNIRERSIVHNGDADLREHILNANSTAEAKDTLRIVKRSSSHKIDLCVALSMANERARHYLSDIVMV